ncbi:uncharacterized protein LOC132277566 [Cornus florida]|uniref:uncharacterized protein LOC132277566 n=1 Tax=Cornus florida TaxID=4283 RepID=UPI00289A6230|nr:uncharacterized protein LOC132277566 [Cornus florida]
MSWDKTHHSFIRGNPPSFAGSTDVMLAYQWKQESERHLQMVVCTEVQKQMLATFMLIGNVLQWWESITTIEERTRLTYAEFQTRFDSKYFPLSVRSTMKTEFLDLQQGDMTVAEYEQRFINLSLFAPEEVDTEEKKRDHFVKGLIWPIKMVIIGSPAYTTYIQVVNATLQHCQIRNNYRKSKGDKWANRDFTHQIVESGSSSGTKFNDRGRVQGH